MIERAPTPGLPNPTFALGFALDRDAALRAARAWVRSRSVFTHGGIKRAPLEDLRGIYLPAYLYGALTRTSYAAEIGENYQETETYTTYENGRWVTKTRTVTKTEYRPLQGTHAAYVSDVVVTASRGIPNVELEMVEPFDLRALHRYTPATLSGWIGEEPSMGLADCVQLARREAVDRVGTLLGAFMPGDSHRNLQYQTRLENEIADLVLIPVWVLAVKYDQKKAPVRVLVNGQTGVVGGAAPRSWVRILIAVLLAVGGVVGIVLACVLFMALLGSA